jgi:hypothetical protein
MPVSIRKKGDKYEVRTPHGVKAKRTTRQKAVRQKRLLDAIEHGYKPKKQRHHSCENGEFLDDRINRFNVLRN